MQILSTKIIRTAKLLSGMAIIGTLAALSQGAVQASSEDSIKAAYVYNFAKLIDNPAGGGSYVVGIIGSSSAGDAIESILGGKSVNGRSVVIKHVSDGAAKTCQLVFVCNPGGPPSTGGASVITVGESSGFAGGGGCLGFTNDGGRVHFELNQSSLHRAHLNASAKLVALAKVVG